MACALLGDDDRVVEQEETAGGKDHDVGDDHGAGDDHDAGDDADHHTNHSCNCSVLYCRRMRPAQRRTKPDLMLPSRRRSLGAGGTVGVRKGGGRHTAATTATETHATQPAPAATTAVLRRTASLRF